MKATYNSLGHENEHEKPPKPMLNNKQAPIIKGT